MRGRVFITLSLSAVIALLVIAPGAFAQSPADSVYNPNGQVLNVVQGGGNGNTPSGTAGATTPTQVESGTNSLPFTGFQAGLVALAGLALVGTGVAMRRIARGPDHLT